MWYIHTNEVLFSHKQEQTCVICSKMDGTGDHHVMQNKPETDKYQFRGKPQKYHERNKGTIGVRGG
jgi:hypothetical protein